MKQQKSIEAGYQVALAAQRESANALANSSHPAEPTKTRELGPMPQTEAVDFNGAKLHIDRPEPKRDRMDIRQPKATVPRPTMALDLLVARWATARMVNGFFLLHDWYTAGRSFLTTHRLGWVKPHTYHLRRSICDKCSHRYQDKGAQQSFCGFKGGCGCGHRRGASLSNKLTLTGWSCPAGKFGKGDNDEKLIQVDIDRRE